MVICQLCFKKCSVSSSKKRNKREKTLETIFNAPWKDYNTLQMLTVCVIMSLSVYLYHNRIHKNSMLWVTRWIRSCLSYKVIEITECSLMIYIVPKGNRDNTVILRDFMSSYIRKRCEEFHSKTLYIQIQHKIKPLPEVYHSVSGTLTGSAR